jgi:hypothetical protein
MDLAREDAGKLCDTPPSVNNEAARYSELRGRQNTPLGSERETGYGKDYTLERSDPLKRIKG